jgi:hypothetical protein
LLGLFHTGQANYHEFETTLHFRPVKNADLNVSYIWSRARGDLNTVSSVFLPFEQPVIRPNVSGILPSDVPNRVVSWGVFHLPWSLTVSPVVDLPVFDQSHESWQFSRSVQQCDFAILWEVHWFPASCGWLHSEFR